MTVHCTANRGRNGNRLITITEKTVSVSVEIILFRKNLKDEVKLQKKYGLIAKIHKILKIWDNPDILTSF